jgi:hypothetical protein
VNDWLFMGVVLIAVTLICVLGVDRQRNPQRPRRR